MCHCAGRESSFSSCTSTFSACPQLRYSVMVTFSLQKQEVLVSICFCGNCPWMYSHTGDGDRQSSKGQARACHSTFPFLWFCRDAVTPKSSTAFQVSFVATSSEILSCLFHMEVAESRATPNLVSEFSGGFSSKAHQDISRGFPTIGINRVPQIIPPDLSSARLPTRPAMTRSSSIAFCYSAAGHGQTAMEMHHCHDLEL